MAMNFKYDGTTWVVTDAQLPNYKDRSLEQVGSLRRTFAGSLRRYNRFSKWTLPFSWTDVEAAVRTHVLAMSELASSGTVTVESTDGTVICKPVDQSYAESESSWASYNLGITLKEV
jgi:hypothetical protein